MSSARVRRGMVPHGYNGHARHHRLQYHPPTGPPTLVGPEIDRRSARRWLVQLARMHPGHLYRIASNTHASDAYHTDPIDPRLRRALDLARTQGPVGGCPFGCPSCQLSRTSGSARPRRASSCELRPYSAPEGRPNPAWLTEAFHALSGLAQDPKFLTEAIRPAVAPSRSPSCGTFCPGCPGCLAEDTHYSDQSLGRMTACREPAGLHAGRLVCDRSSLRLLSCPECRSSLNLGDLP